MTKHIQINIERVFIVRYIKLDYFHLTINQLIKLSQYFHQNFIRKENNGERNIRINFNVERVSFIIKKRKHQHYSSILKIKQPKIIV